MAVFGLEESTGFPVDRPLRQGRTRPGARPPRRTNELRDVPLPSAVVANTSNSQVFENDIGRWYNVA